MKRRELLKSGAGLAFVCLMPVRLPAATRDLIGEMFGDRGVSEGRVTLTTPAIAENGNSVPFDVDVESPMTPTDFVTAIHILAPQNPVPLIATYRLFPGTGSARISSRMRFADSQTVTAIAEMNDGSLWSGTSATIVTLAACVEPLL